MKRSSVRVSVGVGLGVAFVVMFVWMQLPTKKATEDAPPDVPLPPNEACEYVNTHPDAHYLGTKACITCHPKNHESYLLTAHAQALADINLANEPPDGTFEHKASGRTYRVYRANGELHHEESYRDPASGRLLARLDFPIKYVVGSGHFARTYFIEVDGFLHESPITWYTKRQRYDLSPGYDVAQHYSFERPATHGCVKCHSGGVATNGTIHKIAVREQAVGCESCHGPGSKHAARYRDGQKPPGPDLTIVNPNKLSRSLSEAICAECHLGSIASVRLRGRGPDDYRPGMPLSNQRVDYRAVGDEGRMTVTGHIEQLRLSKCYTNSQLTCTTCHDPHAKAKPADPAAFYRQQCINCHTPEKCKAPAADRAKTTPADACINCHMPKGDTDIPHLAFSHHRIGIHRGEPPAPKGAPVLVPVHDDSALSPADRKRNLALANLEAATKQGYTPFKDTFEERALPLLEDAYAKGLRDPETLRWLSRLGVEKSPKQAVAQARLVVDDRSASPEMRGYSLMLLANAEFNNKQYAKALQLLQELTTMRRQSDDYRFMGDCHLLAGNLSQAAEAFTKAIAIRPFRPRNHEGLAEVYRRQGNTTKANEHQTIADGLKAGNQE